jgi:hypothetical protein
MTDLKEKSFTERAIDDGIVELSGEGKSERILYVNANHFERWADPEQKVRAEFFAELVYEYDYGRRGGRVIFFHDQQAQTDVGGGVRGLAQTAV